MKFLLGIIVGIVISTVGVSGTLNVVSKFLDNGVNKVKQVSQEQVRD
jgi:hypothetical protein